MADKIKPKLRGVILGGGEIINYDAIKAILKDDDFIVCADSGYYHTKPLEIEADLLVGDFDSLKEVPSGIPKVSLPEEKNYTDTTFAVEAAIHQGCDEIMLVGMLGGRLDHTLANLQSLVYCTNQGIKAFITDGRAQVFCVVADESSPSGCYIDPVDDYYFSLVSFSEQCKGVTIEGGKYPLENHTLTFDLARAISNEFVGEQVNIDLKDGTLLIILEPK